MHDEFRVANNYNMIIGLEVILVIFMLCLFILRLGNIRSVRFMLKQFSIISVLILMFTIVANANDVNLPKNAEDRNQRKNGISKSSFVSDLTKLSICASLQINNETIFNDNKDGFHIHASWHPSPVLNSIPVYLRANLYSKNFIDKMSQKSQIKLGELLYSFNNNRTRKPHEVFCSATQEKEPCEINSLKTLELSCIRSLINVHMKYGSYVNGFGSLIPRIADPKHCRPTDLLRPLASHHENEKKLKNFIYEHKEWHHRC